MNNSTIKNDKGKKYIFKSVRDVVVIAALACVIYFVSDEKVILQKILENFTNENCSIIH